MDRNPTENGSENRQKQANNKSKHKYAIKIAQIRPIKKDHDMYSMYIV